MELSAALKGKIEGYLHGHKVVLFMKGTRQQPMCGFSARTVAALDSVLPDYMTVNVLDDAVRRDNRLQQRGPVGEICRALEVDRPGGRATIPQPV